MRNKEDVMIRELTDMELDAVCGGGKKHRKHSSKSITQKVDVDQSNFSGLFVGVNVDSDGGNQTNTLNQENEANIALIAVNA
jgi:hypothetical protein